MSELRILTTDAAFVDDLNGAGIEGMTAKYDPTMAYDSAEHLAEIVIGGIAAESIRLLREWIVERFKKTPPRQFTVVSGDNATNIISYVEHEKEPTPRKKPVATASNRKKPARRSKNIGAGTSATGKRKRQ